jgi:cysteinyl-tRNA synthetase
MRIYNSLSQQIEEFKPFDPPHVGLYACGPTVYDYAHLGHLRKYTMDDVLIRTLRHADYKVTHVQNVTDVGHLASDADTGEDKLEKGAKKYQLSVQELARKFENFFYDSMDKMNNQRPDVVCRATQHIDEMLDLVKKLEKKGYTYIIEGDGVYFDTSKLDDYGKLSPLDLEQLQEGARVEKVEGKRNPTDFALWKFERSGENRAMSWPSPWAKKSFPGWHIECSAMSMKYLGEQFDIHTGGIDHLAIHHPNEIAQSEAATGKKPFVKYWVHHNFLTVDGEKMSKSKGNFFTILDIEAKGFEPMALRLLFLQSHYRSQLNFTWESLEAAQTSWNKLKRMLADWQGLADKYAQFSSEAQAYQEQFINFIENDLKTPEAVAVLWEVVKSDLPKKEKRALLLEFDQILGLGLNQITADQTGQVAIEDLPAEIQQLLDKRNQARQDQDWSSADKIRQQISKLGYQVEDTPQGQAVRRSSSAPIKLKPYVK